MTVCGECGCRADIGPDRFWTHACRHGDAGHKHVVPFVVSDKQWEAALAR